jgi:hypothetical protein
MLTITCENTKFVSIVWLLPSELVFYQPDFNSFFLFKHLLNRVTFLIKVVQIKRKICSQSLRKSFLVLLHIVLFLRKLESIMCLWFLYWIQLRLFLLLSTFFFQIFIFVIVLIIWYDFFFFVLLHSIDKCMDLSNSKFPEIAWARLKFYS